MNQIIARLVLSGLCLTLLGCTSSPLEKKSAGRVIAPSARSIGLLETSGEWTPSDTDIAQLETAIGHLFARPDQRLRGVLTRDKRPSPHAPFPLSDYYVKYAGIVRDGKRLIIGKASHRGDRPAAQALKIPAPNPNGEETVVLDVCGGGTRFFTVTYDPTQRTIIVLAYNAPL